MLVTTLEDMIIHEFGGQFSVRGENDGHCEIFLLDENLGTVNLDPLETNLSTIVDQLSSMCKATVWEDCEIQSDKFISRPAERCMVRILDGILRIHIDYENEDVDAFTVHEFSITPLGIQPTGLWGLRCVVGGVSNIFTCFVSGEFYRKVRKLSTHHTGL